MLGRWIADYDDPDNFTFTLFHSGNGRLRNLLLLAGEPTGSSRRPAPRPGRPPAEDLYRKFEHVLLDSAILVPLFHDVDYRIASANVRGLQLRSTAPYVNYAEVGKAQAPAVRAASERPAGGGILNVPIAGVVRSFDTALSVTAEDSEVHPTVFETLTWAVEGTRIVPWLASEVIMENEGTRFRFRLRPGVRFHDGRRLTARDVRHSFERLLANPQSAARGCCLPSVEPSFSRAPRPTSRGSTSSRERSSSSIWRSPSPSSPPCSPTRRRRSSRRGPGSSGRACGRAPSARAPSGSSASSRAGGSSSSATRTTGARAIPGARASSFGSGFRPRRSATSSWPAGSRSRRICFRPTPKPSGTIPGSRRATGRARA